MIIEEYLMECSSPRDIASKVIFIFFLRTFSIFNLLGGYIKAISFVCFSLSFLRLEIMSFKRTTPDQRMEIFNLLKNDVSMEKIANSYGISKSTVSRIRKRYNETKKFTDAPRKPRSKKMIVQKEDEGVLEKKYQSEIV